MTEAHKNARTRAIELRFVADELERISDLSYVNEVRVIRLAACELDRMHAECCQAWAVIDSLKKTIRRIEIGEGANDGR